MSPFDLSKYEPVEDRLAKFWADHPDGRLETELVKAEDGEFIVKASVYKDRVFRGWTSVADMPEVHSLELMPADATGFAQEREGSSTVNKTSALENCETSAIGRALANLGYAPKGARPSREEMSKASRRTSDSGTSRRGEGPGSSPSLPESVSPEAERHGARGEPATARGVAAHETPPASGTTSAPPVIGSGGTAESGSGVAADGEAAAAPDPGQLPHEAVWIQSPKVKSMVVCEVPRCVLHPARRKDEAVSA